MSDELSPPVNTAPAPPVIIAPPPPPISKNRKIKPAPKRTSSKYGNNRPNYNINDEKTMTAANHASLAASQAGSAAKLVIRSLGKKIGKDIKSFTKSELEMAGVDTSKIKTPHMPKIKFQKKVDKNTTLEQQVNIPKTGINAAPTNSKKNKIRSNFSKKVKSIAIVNKLKKNKKNTGNNESSNSNSNNNNTIIHKNLKPSQVAKMNKNKPKKLFSIGSRNGMNKNKPNSNPFNSNVSNRNAMNKNKPNSNPFNANAMNKNKPNTNPFNTNVNNRNAINKNIMNRNKRTKPKIPPRTKPKTNARSNEFQNRTTKKPNQRSNSAKLFTGPTTANNESIGIEWKDIKLKSSAFNVMFKNKIAQKKQKKIDKEIEEKERKKETTVKPPRKKLFGDYKNTPSSSPNSRPSSTNNRPSSTNSRRTGEYFAEENKYAPEMKQIIKRPEDYNELHYIAVDPMAKRRAGGGNRGKYFRQTANTSNMNTNVNGLRTVGNSGGVRLPMSSKLRRKPKPIQNVEKKVKKPPPLPSGMPVKKKTNDFCGILQVFPESEKKIGWIYSSMGMIAIPFIEVQSLNTRNVKPGHPILFEIIGYTANGNGGKRNSKIRRIAKNIRIQPRIKETVIAQCLTKSKSKQKSKSNAQYYVFGTQIEFDGTLSQNAFEIPSLVNTQQIVKLCESILNAFLNTDGGTLYFGIDSLWNIKGIQTKSLNVVQIEHSIQQMISTFKPQIPKNKLQIKITWIAVVMKDGTVMKNNTVLRVNINGPITNAKNEKMLIATKNGDKYKKQLSYIVKFV